MIIIIIYLFNSNFKRRDIEPSTFVENQYLFSLMEDWSILAIPTASSPSGSHNSIAWRLLENQRLKNEGSPTLG